MSDVVIIGGGPAGASAATFAARAGLDTVVIDAGKGITRRALLNNHLGFPEGIDGPELLARGRAQAERSGATWVEGTVEAIEGAAGGFAVRTDDARTFEAASVILATGITTDLAKATGVATQPGSEPRIATVAALDAQGRSSVPGIWVAGVFGGVSAHTIITGGDGARVAINLISELRGARHVDPDVIPAAAPS
jgi:thioredoxin reductase